MFQSVAVARHVNNPAAVNEAIQDSGGNGSVTKEVGPLVKALVGSNNEGRPLAHSGDETKEQVGFSGREGHEAHLIHHHAGGFVEVLKATFAGAGYLSGFEDGHERVQCFKGHGIAQVEALDSQRECEVSLAHAGRAEEADVKGLLHPSHVGQTEHLLPGNAALEAEAKRIQRFFDGEAGSLSAQEVLLEDTQPLLFREEQFHRFQRGKAVLPSEEGVKVHLGIAQVGQQVVHPFQRRQHLGSPTFA